VRKTWIWSVNMSATNTLRGKNGLHAFGNNSAESKPIWMKSGTVWAKCWATWQILGAIRAVATVWVGSFFKKAQKLLTKFPGLATSSCHNSAVITNAENSRPNGPSTWCLVSIFTVKSLQSLSLGMYVAYQKETSPNFRQRPLSDIVQ